MKESRVISIIFVCVVLVVLSMSCLNTDEKMYLLYKQDVTLKYGHFGLAPEGTTFTVLPNDVFKNEDITSPEREGFEPNSPICSISVIYENSFR